MENYERLGILGEGQYGRLYRVRDLHSGEILALKKPFLNARDGEGIPAAVIREVRVLRELSHPNIVACRNVFFSGGTLYVALEAMHCDLQKLIQHPRIVFPPSHVKAVMQRMLLGLEHLHANQVLHRDLSPANVLLSSRGAVKLADFGFARSVTSPTRPWSPGCVTLWYRAPELLMGARMYSKAIDMWAAGCIFAEMWLREAYMAAPVDSELQQLAAIFGARGTPKEATWPGFSSLPNAVQFEYRDPPTPAELQATFPAVSPDALDLLSKILVLDPNRRLSATDALRHRYFSADPKPASDTDFEFLLASMDEMQS